MSRQRAIEATAKRWKFSQAVGSLAMLVGGGWVIGAMFLGAPVPVWAGVAAAAGLAAYLAGRAGGWWYHG